MTKKIILRATLCIILAIVLLLVGYLAYLLLSYSRIDDNQEIGPIKTGLSEEVKLGESYTLEPVVLPVNAFDKTVTFTSSDEGILTVENIETGDYTLAIWNEKYSGLNESQSNHIDIYPNPTNDIINIKLKNEIKENIIITNQLGQVVKKTNIDGKEIVINVEDFTSGVYFINVSNQKMKFLKN